MALGTTLPIWPALLFAWIEPVMLISGTYVAFSDPTRFAQTQVPITSVTTTVTPSVLNLTYMLGNIYYVLGFMSILALFISRESRVQRYYLIFISIGDLGHIYCSYLAMSRSTAFKGGRGTAQFWDIGGYNDMMWGNIGVSFFLWLNRIMTLSGLFGEIRGSVVRTGGHKKRS